MNFDFEGRQIAATSQDTIASALYRSGLREFGVSFAYRRPRGLLCVSGNCTNCQMHVNGVPNVTTCTAAAQEGMRVSRQTDDPGASTSGIGLGKVPGPEAAPAEYEHRYAKAEIVVIGGGPEGIQAALEAAKSSAGVWLVEKDAALGGRTRWLEPERAAALTTELSSSGVTLLVNAPCCGIYEGNLLAIVEKHPLPWIEERLLHLRAARVIVATGSYETPLLFENNDLPGIMLLGGAQRLLQFHSVLPGKRALIAGPESQVAFFVSRLAEAGCDVLGRIDANEILRAEGDRSLDRVITKTGAFVCDLLVIAGPRVPEASLLTQAGAKLSWDESADNYGVSDLPSGVEWCPDEYAQSPQSPPLPSLAEHEFTCTCHDVTSRELQDAIDAGFTHIETLKRVTKAMKGNCQSRMCALATAAHCAHATGNSLAQVGSTVLRPPNPPISLGALAGMHPPTLRLTPVHDRHVRLNPAWTNMAGWIRPRFYGASAGTPESDCVLAEYSSIRERVGIIDVSTLGKLSVCGPDAGWLLDRCYTHRFANLKPGRARYAVMCDEAGAILDDGMIARLSDAEFLVSTTTSNANLVQQIMELQLVDNLRAAAIVNLTAAHAAFNVAGPLARLTLAKLTSIPLGAESFPYMHCRQGEVAGIPATLIRIGFVGETGWEIHFRADRATAMWDSILEAGEEFGIRPVGVETQRVLRLEKKHIIVGIDTDALSTPFSTGLSWAVKFDKEDFLGRAMLAQFAAQQLKDQLVGFTSSFLPHDGAAVVLDGYPVGRVTSARYSPHRGTNIGLAWAPTQLVDSGAALQIASGSETFAAELCAEAFYDAAGLRLQM
jgi:sarcosine oxidase, subunit alpha